MTRSIIALVALGLVNACSSGQDAATDTMPPADSSDMGAPAGGDARVTLQNSSGAEVGVLTVVDQAGGLMLTGTVRGMPPGTHGIHIHMTGQCTPPFESAGGHWNPTGLQHGRDNPQGAHLGDLMNIEVGADSTATVSLSTPGGSLRGTNALMDADGASVVVHAGPDDNKTDPAGNSGARIACGVVG